MHNEAYNQIDPRTFWGRLYISSLGSYGTIACMFGILYVLQIHNMGFWSKNFVAFFLVVLFRALFDATVIQNTPLDKIDFTKFVRFACKGSLILVLILFVLKGVLGDWSPLVTIVLSSTILKKVQKKVWPNQKKSYPNNLKNREFSDAERHRFDSEKSSPLLDIGADFSESKMGRSVKEKTDSSGYLGMDSQQLQFLDKASIYQRFHLIFIGLLTFFTYSGICIWSMHQFIPIFGVSLFFALFVQMVLEWVFVYDQKIDTVSTLRFIAGSAFGSLATVVFFSFLMQQCVLSGKAATIISVIALKSIQPWFIYFKLPISVYTQMLK